MRRVSWMEGRGSGTRENAPVISSGKMDARTSFSSSCSSSPIVFSVGFCFAMKRLP